jgi:hypothetical protein
MKGTLVSVSPIEASLADLPPLLTPRQFAELRGVTEAALTCERWKGSGPPYIKANRRIRYAKVDVINFLSANRVEQVERELIKPAGGDAA